jgi:pimeloyl-ACP methyl ester carboxylesterase
MTLHVASGVRDSVLRGLPQTLRIASILCAAKGVACAVRSALTLLVLATRSVARRYLFPAASASEEPNADDVLMDRKVAGDGMPVRALELRSPFATRTLVYFHNNRETAEGLVDLGRALRGRGFDVVLAVPRLRGPSEEGLYADAEAILDLLAARGVGSDRIVLWGASLGTGVAAEMARRGGEARDWCVSPYTSIPDPVTDVVPCYRRGSSYRITSTRCPRRARYAFPP